MMGLMVALGLTRLSNGVLRADRVRFVPFQLPRAIKARGSWGT